jgi:hypothetical protein
MRHIFALYLVLLGIALWGTFAYRYPPQGDAAQSKPPAEWEVVASWLPADTETFIIVNTPYHFRQMHGPTSLADSMKLIELMAYPDELSHPLEGIKFEMAVAGRGNFQAPSNVGIGQHDGCEIFKIDPRETANLVAKLAPLKPTTETIGNLETTVVKVEDWTWFVAIDNDLLFVATDRDYLAEVLERRQAEPSRLDTSGELWAHVDTSAQVFAVRTFTERLRKEEAANLNDDQIVGYAMTLDEAKDELRVVSVSDSPEGFERAHIWLQFFGREDWQGEFSYSRLSDRATQITLQASADATFGSIFMAYALGHLIFF